MKVKGNELAAVVYADLFGYPLTVSEAKLWAIRRVRKKNADRKLALAQKVTFRLKRIPTIEGIFLTGSVAVGNAKEDADIDLMIVTHPGVLWLTRMIVFMLLKSLKLLRSFKNHKNKICPNIFLDTRHLEINEKNLYTAHEVLQAKCLFDRGNSNYLWLKENKWTAEYLPNAYKSQKLKVKSQKYNAKAKILAWIFEFCLLPFESLTFLGQYLYMWSKMTNERVGWGYAFFHPRNLSEKVVGEFERRLYASKNSSGI